MILNSHGRATRQHPDAWERYHYGVNGGVSPRLYDDGDVLDSDEENGTSIVTRTQWGGESETTGTYSPRVSVHSAGHVDPVFVQTADIGTTLTTEEDSATHNRQTVETFSGSIVAGNGDSINPSVPGTVSIDGTYLNKITEVNSPIDPPPAPGTRSVSSPVELDSNGITTDETNASLTETEVKEFQADATSTGMGSETVVDRYTQRILDSELRNVAYAHVATGPEVWTAQAGFDVENGDSVPDSHSTVMRSVSFDGFSDLSDRDIAYVHDASFQWEVDNPDGRIIAWWEGYRIVDTEEVEIASGYVMRTWKADSHVSPLYRMGMVEADPPVPAGRVKTHWFAGMAPNGIEVNSMDRFVTGSISEELIDESGGEGQVSLRIKHDFYPQTFEASPLSSKHIYDNEEDILDQSEIDLGQTEPNAPQFTQDIVLFRKDGRLHFATVLDRPGPIEITLTAGGRDVAGLGHILHPNEDVGGLIDTADEILADEWRHETDPDAPEPDGNRDLEKRNLVTKMFLPLWDEAEGEGWFNKGKLVVVGGFKLWVAERKGFFEGIWSGLKGDVMAIPGLVDEITKVIDNPVEVAATYYDSFKHLFGMTAEERREMTEELIYGFLNDVERALPFEEPTDGEMLAYVTGFTNGFLAEQVAITYVTAGVASGLKAGQFGKFVATVVDVAKAGNVVLGPSLSAARKLKNSMFRRLSQRIESPGELRRVRKLIDILHPEACRS